MSTKNIRRKGGPKILYLMKIITLKIQEAHQDPKKKNIKRFI